MPKSKKTWYIGNKLPYNYAHFFHYFLFPYSLVKNIEDMELVFCFDLNNFQKQYLKLLNISNYKQILNPKLEIESFLVPPSYKYGNNILYSDTEMKLNIAMVKNLRDILLQKIDLDYRQKIYIDRGPYLRNISNHSLVYEFLKNKGFYIIELSRLSVKEQLSLFSNATTIVAPHGASLSNILVCNKNCKIIEIRTNFVRNNTEFSSIAKILELKFDTVFTDENDAVKIEDLRKLLV